jgi:hypothetical protein
MLPLPNVNDKPSYLRFLRVALLGRVVFRAAVLRVVALAVVFRAAVLRWVVFRPAVLRVVALAVVFWAAAVLRVVALAVVFRAAVLRTPNFALFRRVPELF